MRSMHRGDKVQAVHGEIRSFFHCHLLHQRQLSTNNLNDLAYGHRIVEAVRIVYAELEGHLLLSPTLLATV